MARRSKAVCKGSDGLGVCPHLIECGLYALDHKIRYGIWGGMSERDRVAYRKKEKQQLAAERQRMSEAADTPAPRRKKPVTIGTRATAQRRKRRVIIGGTHHGTSSDGRAA